MLCMCMCMHRTYIHAHVVHVHVHVHAHAPHIHTLGLQVRNEMEGLMGKLEKDLTESLIKVILQSRVTKRKADVPDGDGRSRRSSKSLVSSSARSEASEVGSEEGAAPQT